MIALRMLSFVAGALVLVLPPMLLADASPGGLPGVVAAGTLLGLALMSASFVHVGMAGNRMRRNTVERRLGGLLLAVPILGSLGVLATRKEVSLLWGSGVLLAFSLLLFLSFVYPMAERRQRPMRRRERQEPVLAGPPRIH